MICTRRPRSFWTSCRCDACHIDRTRKHKLYTMGRIQRIPHEVAWKRLTDRFAEGWTALAAASACGLPAYYFSDHHAAWTKGAEVRIGPHLAHQIMTMGRPTAGQVNAEPSRRRLRALAVMGYGLHSLSLETGIKPQTLAMIRRRNERVGSAAAASIADAYDRLHMRPGGCVQAATVARRKRWAAPLAWDDIDLDAAPQGVIRGGAA